MDKRTNKIVILVISSVDNGLKNATIRIIKSEARMAFKRFTYLGKSIAPRITIRRGGQIGISDSAVKRYGLEKYQYAVLYMDEEAQRIGIQFTLDPKEEGAKQFKVHKNNGGGTLSAKGFVLQYNLMDLKQKRLLCTFDEKDQMLIAEFKN